MPRRCQQIKSVVERVFAQSLSDVATRLSNLKINGDSRRFVVARMGSTGSTWLAKLLNSHPDVYCTHEGFTAHAYPSRDYTGDDVLKFIEYFAWDNKHEAYQVLGDVGSAWTRHLPYLKSFTTSLLVRHPARVLNTRLAIDTDQSYSAIPPESLICIREIWGIEPLEYAPIDRVFLHDAFIFASQVCALEKADVVIRITLVQNSTYSERPYPLVMS